MDLLLRSLCEAEGWLCYYCRREMTKDRKARLPGSTATLDHKIPTARGGSGRRGNLVAACHACNNAKGDLTEVEFRVKLPQILEERRGRKKVKQKKFEASEAVKTVGSRGLKSVTYATDQFATYSLAEILGPALKGGVDGDGRGRSKNPGGKT